MTRCPHMVAPSAGEGPGGGASGILSPTGTQAPPAAMSPAGEAVLLCCGTGKDTSRSVLTGQELPEWPHLTAGMLEKRVGAGSLPGGWLRALQERGGVVLCLWHQSSRLGAPFFSPRRLRVPGGDVWRVQSSAGVRHLYSRGTDLIARGTETKCGLGDRLQDSRSTSVRHGARPHSETSRGSVMLHTDAHVCPLRDTARFTCGVSAPFFTEERQQPRGLSVSVFVLCAHFGGLSAESPGTLPCSQVPAARTGRKSQRVFLFQDHAALRSPENPTASETP